VGAHLLVVPLLQRLAALAVLCVLLPDGRRALVHALDLRGPLGDLLRVLLHHPLVAAVGRGLF